MIGIVATLKVREDAVEQFEAAFTGLSRQVREKEADAQFYQLFKSRTEPGVYRVLENYASEAALAAHMKSDHFVAAMAVVRPCLAAPPQMERMDAVAG